MKNLYKIATILFLCLLIQSCSDYPVDENGLLVTDREECYMSSFELWGPDDRNTLVETKIDDEAGTITATARFGTNISHVKPQCSIVQDAIVQPKMGVWTDFSQPLTYTVISGNRQVTKTYTVTIKVQGE